MTDTINQEPIDPAKALQDWLANEDGTHFGEHEKQVAALLENYDAIQDRLAILTKEVASARGQRDYLGFHLSDRIARFHALRVAFGETSMDTATRTTAAEVTGFQNECKGIAQQAGVEV